MLCHTLSWRLVTQKPGDCLPFLYRAQTILRATTRQSRFYSKTEFQTRNVPFSKSKSGLHFDHRPLNDIPFEDGQLPIPQSNLLTDSVEEKAQTPNSRRSTLTASEKAIFSRILEEDSQRSWQASTEEDYLDQDPITPGDPYEDLNAIFDLAIQELNLREEQRAQRVVRSRANHAVMPVKKALEEMGVHEKPHYLSLSTEGELLKGFSRPLQFADGRLTQPPIGDTEESDERLRTACDQHRALIRAMLENTSTDVEVWNILQNEVFSMIKQLHLQMDHEDKLLKAPKGKQDKPPKSSSKAKAKAKAKNRTSNALAPNDDTELENWQSPMSSHVFSPLFTESKALTTNTLLAILQANYSHYNVLALRLWRRRYPTTPYALHLLPHIKSLGPISYVLGASANLYNEVLFVKWSQYNDLHGIADLLQEMINQGVEPNILTLGFLRYVSRTRRRDMAGRRGNVLRSWWYLRGVKEGWAKVKSMYGELRGRFQAIEGVDLVGKEGEESLVDKIENTMNEDEERVKDERGVRIKKLRSDPGVKQNAEGRARMTRDGFGKMRYHHER